MLRVFLVALALIGLASAGFRQVNVDDEGYFPTNPVHQATWGLDGAESTYQLADHDGLNGEPSTFFYFCHSYCTFNGNYEFQRFWQEEDFSFVDRTSIFDWSVDGSTDFWDTSSSSQLDDCDAVIEYYRYYPQCIQPGCTLQYSESRLENCRPAWIYIENVVVNYNRDGGRFTWKHYIDKAFQPTEAQWNIWADRAHLAKTGSDIFDGNSLDYDQFDGLFREYPSADGATLTDDYSKDYYYEETYVSNYEPNYCSMQMSHRPVDKKLWCYGSLIEDSDNVDYPTAQYCAVRGAWIIEDDLYNFGCGIGDSDDCDSVNIYDNPNTRRDAKKARGGPSKTERLRQATASHQQLAAFEKRGARYNGVNDQVSYYSPSNLFYYQNFAAGLRFPFCATKA